MLLIDNTSIAAADSMIFAAVVTRATVAREDTRVAEAVPVDEAGLSAGLQEAMNTSSHKKAVAGRKTGQ